MHLSTRVTHPHIHTNRGVHIGDMKSRTVQGAKIGVVYSCMPTLRCHAFVWHACGMPDCFAGDLSSVPLLTAHRQWCPIFWANHHHRPRASQRVEVPCQFLPRLAWRVVWLQGKPGQRQWCRTHLHPHLQRCCLACWLHMCSATGRWLLALECTSASDGNRDSFQSLLHRAVALLLPG